MKQAVLRVSLAWIIVENIVTVATAIFSTFYVARVIGPHAFGLASLAFFIGSLAETLVATPFVESLIQRRRLDVAVIDTAHTAMAIAGILVFALVSSIAFPISNLYGEPQLTLLIVGQASTSVLLGFRSASEAVLSRKYRFRALSIRNIGAKLAAALISILMAMYGAGAWSLVAGSAVFGITSTFTVMSVMARKPKFRFKWNEVVQLLRFGVFVFLDAILWTATPRIFGFLFGYFHGVQAVGLLNVAFRINDTVCAILASICARMALPIFARIAHQRDHLIAAFANGTRLTFLIAAPSFAGVALVSRETVEIFLGAEWISASLPLVIVCIYSVFNFSRVLAQPAIKAIGKPSLLIWLHFVGLAYVIVGSIAAAPLGLKWHLWVWASFGAVYVLSSIVVLKWGTGIELRAQVVPLLPGATYTICMIAAVVMMPVSSAIASPFRTLVWKVGLGISTYALLLIVFEREKLRALFRSDGELFFRRSV